jgi:hypothetical protein
MWRTLRSPQSVQRHRTTYRDCRYQKQERTDTRVAKATLSINTKPHMTYTIAGFRVSTGPVEVSSKDAIHEIDQESRCRVMNSSHWSMESGVKPVHDVLQPRLGGGDPLTLVASELRVCSVNDFKPTHKNQASFSNIAESLITLCWISLSELRGNLIDTFRVASTLPVIYSSSGS